MSYNFTEVSKKLPKFKKFLESAGAEMLEPTNDFEIVRFDCDQGVGIAYRNNRGRVTFCGPAGVAWEAYLEAKPWSAGKKSSRGNLTPKIRTLLKRDGENCFLCWKPLGVDITIEHLLALAHKGSNHISNLALTHCLCNALLGHRPVMEKIKMREDRRPKPVVKGKGVDVFFPQPLGALKIFDPPKQPDLTPEQIEKMKAESRAETRANIHRMQTQDQRPRIQHRLTPEEALNDMVHLAECHASQFKNPVTTFPAYIAAYTEYCHEAGAEADCQSQFAEGS